jgi:hypothetical protein
MTTGSDFIRTVQGLGDNKFAQWSAAAKALLLAGGAEPSWQDNKRWQPVTVSLTDPKTKASHVLTYYVAPDFFSIGTDGDFVLAPLTPQDAQAVLDARNAILPTKRMVLATAKQAAKLLPLSNVKGPPFNVPLTRIESTEAYIDAMRLDRNQYTAAPASGIVTGHRKNVVTGPNLDGSHVAIYGGYAGVKGDKNFPDGMFWQPYSTIHVSSYGDYSHGVQSVSRVASLDGNLVDLVDVFTNPQLAPLVSDQGAFDPRFPTAGKTVAYSTPTGGDPASTAIYSDGALGASGSPTINKAVLAGAGIFLGYFAARILKG